MFLVFWNGSDRAHLANLFRFIPSLLMIHLRRQERGRGPPPTLRQSIHLFSSSPHPSSSHSSFPGCPSSQHPSPINPPFSSLVLLLLRLVKTAVSGIARALIFEPAPPPPTSSPPGICVTAQGLRARCPHRGGWRPATLEALRDQWTRSPAVNIHSANTNSFVRLGCASQTEEAWRSLRQLRAVALHFPGCEWRGIRLQER